MTDPFAFAVAGSAFLAAFAIVAAAGVRGWRGWLELRREQLACPPPLVSRSDIAALRERVRRLEAIADGAA